MTRLNHGWSLLTLLMAYAALTLPALGTPSLWDVDEGVNAEAAREMLESGNYIVPMFNFELRTAKPVLLYWLQVTAYRMVGVNELGARLPSVFCGLLAVLATWELGRRMFGPMAGLLAGIILASTAQIGIVTHAATPDAVLLACISLTFLAYWIGPVAGGGWAWLGVAAGFGMLAKGPVALVLPCVIIVFHCLWIGRGRELLHGRWLWAFLCVLLVAAPWYVLVGVETRGEWLRVFLGRENLERAMRPMESHSGGIFYHLLVLPIMFAPWSAVLLTAAVAAWIRLRHEPEQAPALRLLVVWAGVWIAAFSVVATKLPNYVAPAYPALALLCGWFLGQILRGELAVPRWLIPALLACLAFTGLVAWAGIFVASGGISWIHGPNLTAVRPWSLAGAVLILGAAWGIYRYWYQDIPGVVGAMAVASVAFTAILGVAAASIDAHKAPRELVAQAGLLRRDTEIRIGTAGWFRPSLVFYAQREVTKLQTYPETMAFLTSPYPAYVVMPSAAWDQLISFVPHCRELARRQDFYSRGEVVVIGNRPAQELTGLVP